MSNLPQVAADNKPPMLRFVRLAEEDRYQSDQTGSVQYKDIVKVYVRAAGDIKCEVPFIAKDKIYIPKKIVTDVKSEITRTVKDPNTGEMVQMKEPVTERVEKEVMDESVIYPWLDQLRDKLRNGWITQEYYDFCKGAFDRYMANEDEPLDGVPLKDWRGATEAIKRKAIEIGINTVQKAAEMTEEAMQAIGIGARDLKTKATIWLEADNSPAVAARKIENLQEENEALMERMAAMEAMLKQGNQHNVVNDTPAKRKGRPPNVGKALVGA
jgi:hypothetical protein